MEPVNRKKGKDNSIKTMHQVVNIFDGTLFLNVNKENKTGSSRAEPNRLSINYSSYNKKRYLNVNKKERKKSQKVTQMVRIFHPKIDYINDNSYINFFSNHQINEVIA